MLILRWCSISASNNVIGNLFLWVKLHSSLIPQNVALLRNSVYRGNQIKVKSLAWALIFIKEKNCIQRQTCTEGRSCENTGKRPSTSYGTTDATGT